MSPKTSGDLSIWQQLAANWQVVVMARILGRFETPGCCPGTRAGWRRRRHSYGPDCSGAGTDTRWRKRVEQRELRREINAYIAEET